MRLRFDDYSLDVARHELWRGSEPVVVEPQVFDLLAYLVQHPERVVTRDELLQAVWDGRIVSESAITNRVNAARRAIGDSGEKQRLIRTVPRPPIWASSRLPNEVCMTSTPCAFTDPSQVPGRKVEPLYRATPPVIVSGPGWPLYGVQARVSFGFPSIVPSKVHDTPT